MEHIAGLGDDVAGLSDAQSIAAIAELDREHPDALLLIETSPLSRAGDPLQAVDMAKLKDATQVSAWVGKANPLSNAHVQWEVIDEAAEAAWHVDEAITTGDIQSLDRVDRFTAPSAASPAGLEMKAAEIIQQRRSAVAFDGRTAITAEAFYNLLNRLLPRPGIAPWDAWPWPAHVHCAIFVHRVTGLPPGLYMLERSATVDDRLRSSLRPEFLWQHPGGCPEHLPLFKLIQGDFRESAQMVSCHQGIAGDGAFSLGMIADFGQSIRDRGAWWYRRLFWEAGMVGQVLYLEAEVAGVRGTGIGCYFDDAVHKMLGLDGDRFQSLYHFTVGGPVEDDRLMTLPAYFHLDKAQLETS